MEMTEQWQRLGRQHAGVRVRWSRPHQQAVRHLRSQCDLRQGDRCWQTDPGGMACLRLRTHVDHASRPLSRHERLCCLAWPQADTALCACAHGPRRLSGATGQAQQSRPRHDCAPPPDGPLRTRIGRRSSTTRVGAVDKVGLAHVTRQAGGSNSSVLA